MNTLTIKLTMITIILIAIISSATAEDCICYGTVTYNGNPVSGATVKLYNDGWCYLRSSAPTTEYGNYAILYYGLTGYYHLSVDCSTGWAREAFYRVFPGEPSMVNISLTSNPAPAIPACKD